MPLEDGCFQYGRTYVYIVREQHETFPLQNIYLSYSTALEVALELAKVHNKPFFLDVYQESFNHRQLEFGYTQEVNNE